MEETEINEVEYEEKEETKLPVQIKILEQTEKIMEKLVENDLQYEDIEILSELVDIHKDICNEEYWLRKENDNMNYGNYGNYNGRGPGHGSYGRDNYGEYGRNSYGRRGVDRRYRGHDYMDGMYEGYGRYEEGREEYNRGNYGAKEDTLMSLKYMLEAMVDFVEMLKSEANSQEEIQLIREYTQKISQM